MESFFEENEKSKEIFIERTETIPNAPLESEGGDRRDTYQSALYNYYIDGSNQFNKE